MAGKIYSVYADAPVKPRDLFGDGAIVFRDEQKKAIGDARRHFQKSDKRQQYLWNAKMRFGKTLCALELARQMSKECGRNRLVKRVLIVTHRPVVNESWKEDFQKIFGNESGRFQYGTKFENDSTGNFFDLERHAKRAEENGYVFFASMQYLRRSGLVNDNGTSGADLDNEYLRNSILENDWDLVVIDEAHEGTRTSLGFRVISILKKENTKMLHLSGTPFNLYEDFSDDEIYNWDYVMEQQAKAEWEDKHPGEYNPYAELPHMNIFTYDLAKLVKGRDFAENGVFMFKEFFRTWVGRREADGADMPEGAKGRFVHEAEVREFLDLMCKEDAESNYPFSKEVYQENFNHTLWVVPGVKEARALKQLLEEHEIFQNFDIINVAGSSDDDEKSDNALDAVLNKIGKRPSETATITISCGRLTTGTTVHPWTAVLYLKGSENTSAATYMQTIFRVQSTDTKTYPGKMKAECYVFDFAPNRSLKMIAETAKFANLTSKQRSAANTTSKDDDIARMTQFLNFFSVISLEGGQMVEYEADKLFAQLDHVYIDRIVRNGFNDNLIYDTSYLMSLDEAQIKRLNELGGIIEKTTNMEKPKKASPVQMAQNEEIKSKADKARTKLKNKEPLTAEEREALEEEKRRREEMRKERENRISILRGIALRIPLLIYGAEVDDEEIGITINNLTERIDEASWVEFMPRGITKEIFEEIKPCFNARMFALAARRYRDLAREADAMHIDDRVKHIAEIFSYFHNPDKETVLTPWRVVNMHMSDTLGGYCFFNERFDGPNQKMVEGTEDRLFDLVDTAEPRFVDRGEITSNVFSSSSKILEINSKTGLYPLYVTYSIYCQRRNDYVANDLIDDVNNYSIEEEHVIWDDVVMDNIFVICNTPMAARITERTLLGFRTSATALSAKRHIKVEKLVEQATTNADELVKQLQRVGYWEGTDDNTVMKFNAIVGNPPYQVNDGSGASDDASNPIYHSFVRVSKLVKPEYISLIMPSKWMVGGKAVLKPFRKEMMEDVHLVKIVDFENDREIFPSAHNDGGICYFLYNKSYDKGGLLRYVHKLSDGTVLDSERTLKDGGSDIIIRDSRRQTLIEKVSISQSFSEIVSARKPFGINTDLFNNREAYPELRLSETSYDNSVLIWGVYGIKGGAKRISAYIDFNAIPKKKEWVQKYKLFISKAYSTDATTPPALIVADKGVICTETFLVIGPFDDAKEQLNCYKYTSTKFFRLLLFFGRGTMQVSQEVFRFVPLQDFTNSSDIDWSKSIAEIDQQLYKKYGLTQEEIAFIESMIKPME